MDPRSCENLQSGRRHSPSTKKLQGRRRWAGGTFWLFRRRRRQWRRLFLLPAPPPPPPPPPPAGSDALESKEPKISSKNSSSKYSTGMLGGGHESAPTSPRAQGAETPSSSPAIPSSSYGCGIHSQTSTWSSPPSDINGFHNSSKYSNSFLADSPSSADCWCW